MIDGLIIICNLKPPFSVSSMTQQCHAVMFDSRHHKQTNPAWHTAERAVEVKEFPHQLGMQSYVFWFFCVKIKV